MKSFRDSHPDYGTYRGDHYIIDSVPSSLVVGLKGLVSRFCTGDPTYKWAVNRFLTHVPLAPSTNSNRPWLDGDLDDGLGAITKKPLHKFMDALGELRDRLDRTDFDDALEELMEDSRFGYRVDGRPGNLEWVLRDEAGHSVAAEIEETKAQLGTLCEQAVQHLTQAKSHLTREDDRSRKDAVRDALSAVEALYKALSGEFDIVPAWKKLRDEGGWGPVEIIKDGYVVWQQVQTAYPDARHGQASSSSITHEEALYWIERLLVFVRYLARTGH